MKTEAQLSQHLTKHLRLLKIPYQRLEVTTGAGVPDLAIFFRGRTLWVELKAKTTLIRPEQLVFAHRLKQQDLLSFALVGKSSIGNEACDMITHYTGHIAHDAEALKASYRLSKPIFESTDCSKESLLALLEHLLLQ